MPCGQFDGRRRGHRCMQCRLLHIKVGYLSKQALLSLITMKQPSSVLAVDHAKLVLRRERLVLAPRPYIGKTLYTNQAWGAQSRLLQHLPGFMRRLTLTL